MAEILDEIQRLRKRFPDQITVTYLSGNPGCGKSELARQIGKKYYDEIAREESAKFVTTLNASNLETLAESYMKLAYQLQSSEISTIMNTIISQEQKISQLRGLIAPKFRNYTCWLMIVDNVEDLQLVSKFILHAGENENGHILITTQDSRSIPQRDSHSHHMSLSNGMKPDDAVRSLCAISGCSDEEEMVHSVAKELDFQPLALACAAVCVQRVRIADPTMNWKAYLQDIKKGIRESTEREFEKTSNCYGKSMTTAVTMAIENEIEKSKVMRHAFEFLAAMAPEFISLEHVVNYVMKCLPDDNKKCVATEIMTSSLVLASEDKGKPMVRVHQIVLSVLQSVNEKRNTQKEDELAYLPTVIDVFAYLDTMHDDSIDYMTSIRQLVVHFVSMSYKIKRFLVYSSNPLQFRVAKTLNRLARVLKRLGKYAEAKDCYELLLTIEERTYGGNSREVGVTLHNLGSVLHGLAKYREAEECYKKVLAIEERMHGSNHPEVATSLSSLGTVLRELGRYSEAKKCYEKALAINESTYGSNHLCVAPVLLNMGLVLSDLGKCRKAKECLEKAISIIDDRELGSNRPYLAAVKLCHLGIALRDLGIYSESKECLGNALVETETMYDENHPDIGIVKYQLGLSLHELGQHLDAKVCFEKSIQILETSYGKDHPRLARTLNGLGRLQQEQGHYQAAKVNLDRALAINETSFGENHPQVAVTLNNLGRVFQGLNEYEQAKAYFDRALAINEETCDENHPQIAITLNNLGQVLIKLRKDENGSCCLKRALDIKESNPDYAFKF